MIIWPDDDGKVKHTSMNYTDLMKGVLNFTSKEISLYDAVRIIETNQVKEETWCNMLAGVIAKAAYGAPNISRYKGKDKNANQTAQLLKEGKFNTEKYEYAGIKGEDAYKKAQKYAKNGALVVAVWDSGDKSVAGHVAIITGGYQGRENQGNMKIFQAGGYDEKRKRHNFAYVRFKKGFDQWKWNKVKYYVWRRKK